jgi:hypothetical protein
MGIEYDKEVAQGVGYYQTNNNFWWTSDDHSNGVISMHPGMKHISVISMSMIVPSETGTRYPYWRSCENEEN